MEKRIFENVTVEIAKHKIQGRCLNVYNNNSFVVEDNETIVVYKNVDIYMSDNNVILKNLSLEENFEKCKYVFDSKEEALLHFKEEDIKTHSNGKFYTQGNLKRKFNAHCFYPIQSVVIFDQTDQVEFQFTTL